MKVLGEVLRPPRSGCKQLWTLTPWNRIWCGHVDTRHQVLRTFCVPSSRAECDRQIKEGWEKIKGKNKIARDLSLLIALFITHTTNSLIECYLIDRTCVTVIVCKNRISVLITKQNIALKKMCFWTFVIYLLRLNIIALLRMLLREWH